MAFFLLTSRITLHVFYFGARGFCFSYFHSLLCMFIRRTEVFVASNIGELTITNTYIQTPSYKHIEDYMEHMCVDVAGGKR